MTSPLLRGTPADRRRSHDRIRLLLLVQALVGVVAVAVGAMGPVG